MTQIPSFLSNFHLENESIPDAPPSTPPSKGKAFTSRDHQVVQAILSHAKWAHQLTDIEVSNSVLGKALGMTNGAVSARIKRLAQLGILNVVHLNATDTGENNRRIIHVVKAPPAPFKPWEAKK